MPGAGVVLTRGAEVALRMIALAQFPAACKARPSIP